MKEKLQEYALIAEIVGAIAIVLSLIFVGIQLDRSARATKSVTANEAVSITASWYIAIGNNEQSSSLFWNSMIDPDAQTPEQWYQFVMSCHGLMLSLQNSYYLATEGTLDIEIHESITEAIVAAKDQPGFLLFWQQRRTLFFDEFQDYVDAIITSNRINSEGLYKVIDSE